MRVKVSYGRRGEMKRARQAGAGRKILWGLLQCLLSLLLLQRCAGTATSNGCPPLSTTTITNISRPFNTCFYFDACNCVLTSTIFSSFTFYNDDALINK